MHYLLERQLKKAFNDKFRSSPKLDDLLKAISDTYDNYDKDRKFLERSFDLSSKEFLGLNNRVLKLLEELKVEKESVDQKVVERTQELEERMADLKRFQKLAVDRELKMIELKKEIEEIKKTKQI
ncbi:MAG: hypothetical protein AAB724_02215 [Patescibacteria group bacterium]